ncbi:MAG: acyl-CoA dehydratase activase-related protein [Ruminococcus sp.]|jgi:predicted nucleotide-binding protein (sugar kinase/HSP70/actin superfamily)
MGAVRTIGTPRGLMTYREGILWKEFFTQLGFSYILSPKSDRSILEEGTALAVDETCLPFKMYLGHVRRLLGKCDAIFIPREGGYTPREKMCTRYESLPDLVSNIFRDDHIPVLTFSYDWYGKTSEENVYIKLAESLGKSKKEGKKAYAQAKKTQDAWFKAKEKRQIQKLESSRNKVLLAGHPYVLHDAYMGGELSKILENLDVEVLYTDYVSRKSALKKSYDFSKVIPWLINREVIGASLLLKEKVDGIILVSAYPCGPDSLTDELLLKRIGEIPMLSLTLDAQSGTAGVETRLESFIDIIKYQKAGGYGFKN